ncbi:Peptidyl-tRNA hydrolase, PTH2 [Corchorus capsularis]|uniref:peptidyl-tRNA hydrolase n=1 Tax=Corchorus capsularis TaxID=210143 RepID=A0A1R3IU65_COCAP|nr:Peptidyl-tRNA hydrolase, PTH2 [Corchorus capsularis]
MAALSPLCRTRFTTFLGSFSFTPSRTSSKIRVHLQLPLCLPNRKLSVSSSMSQPSSEPTGAENKDDVLVQYVVLRRDLIDTWPLGSVVTQGCHASVSAIWAHKDDPHTLQYCSPQNIDSMHKVTLEVKGETQIKNLSEKLTAGGIAHKLWIEQPENFPTCLATKPYPKSLVSMFFKKLKLCK